MARLTRWAAACITVVIAAILVVSYFTINNPSSTADLLIQTRKYRQTSCVWKEGDPVVYLIKTKMGVTYTGNHWFHMAENLMAPYSQMRHDHHYSNSSVVYYSFDNGKYVSELNGMTRYLMSLSTTNGNPTQLHYVTHNPNKLDLEVLDIGSVVILNNPHETTPSHAIDMSGSVSYKNKFLFDEARSKVLQQGSQKDICAKFMGSVGGKWPTVQRGHWFPRKGDTEEFRKRTASLCPATSTEIVQYKKKLSYKLTIYQRDLSRLILDVDSIVHRLRYTLGNSWEIEILMNERDRSPCELAHVLHDTDVLVTAHGFQSMLLLFLPRPSLLFEVFPYKYQKAGYSPLCQEYNVLYRGAMSVPIGTTRSWILGLLRTDGPIMTSFTFMRSFARDDDVRMTNMTFSRLFESIDNFKIQLSEYCDTKNSKRFQKASSSVVSCDSIY